MASRGALMVESASGVGSAARRYLGMTGGDAEVAQRRCLAMASLKLSGVIFACPREAAVDQRSTEIALCTGFGLLARTVLRRASAATAAARSACCSARARCSACKAASRSCSASWPSGRSSCTAKSRRTRARCSPSSRSSAAFRLQSTASSVRVLCAGIRPKGASRRSLRRHGATRG